MASDASKLRVERLAWICIYGGLLAVVLSIFLERYDRVLADSLQAAGLVVAAIGALLIYVRSRMG